MKLVIFDLDGTLLNTLDDLADAANYAMTELDFPTHPVESFRYFVGNGVPKLMERCLPEGERSPERISEAVKIFSGYYDKHSADKTRPYDGITELLDRLGEKGISTAVASNKTDSFTQELVKKFFGERFDFVRGGLPDVPKKPAPDIAFGIMSALGAEASDTYFAGDSDVDIITAGNAGVISIGCLWGFRTEKELISAGAVHLAESPDKIYDIIVKE